MLFSSPDFFVFFGLYFLFHLLIPVRHRTALIIVGSSVFYAFWNPAYLWVPYLLLGLGFFGACWIVAADEEPKPSSISFATHPASRRARLWLTVALLLTPLVIIKYTNFFYRDVLGWLFGLSGQPLDISLPLGISFITFTMIAYVVDVYRGRFPIVRKVSTLGGLVLFFPHLIAGPILRPHDLIPQLTHPRPASRWLWVLLPYGTMIFSVGLLKKLVFSDQIAAVVERVFDHDNSALTAFDYVLAIYGFAMQIYCDFSGYTDMAIGAALILGVRLPGNFQCPYSAQSIADFWRRWHITLSRWLRDYLYIPLGGNRHGKPREIVNIIITMTLGGLWHGANWTFVLWGLLNGVGIVASHLIRNFGGASLVAAIPRWLSVTFTFHFVCIGWVIFRAHDMQTAIRVFRGPFVASTESFFPFVDAHVFPIALLSVFFLTHRWDHHGAIRRFVSVAPKALLIPTLMFIWIASIALSAGNSGKFIYFDF